MSPRFSIQCNGSLEPAKSIPKRRGLPARANQGSMADEKKPTTTVSVAAVAPERSSFRSLFLSNPNYFGTFPKLGKVVLPKSFDTAFEQLVCLGLDPQHKKLEAVVQIKQQNGYGTDACGEGSREYVRFFVQHGALWQD